MFIFFFEYFIHQLNFSYKIDFIQSIITHEKIKLMTNINDEPIYLPMYFYLI